MIVLAVLLGFFVLFVVLASAIGADARTGRGYTLLLLSFLLLAYTIFTLLRFSSAPHPTTFGNAYLFITFRSIMLLGDVGATLCVLIGAAIVTLLGGQWVWLAGFVVEAVVLTLAPMLPPSPGLGAIAMLRHEVMDFTFSPVPAALVFIPQATVFAYSVTRLVRSISRSRARLLVPSGNR